MTKAGRTPTIWDVANDVRLSISTVSRAINTPDLLSKDTLEAVRESMERLNYRPSLTAQNLRRSRTNLVLVAVPSFSPFFLEIFRGAEQAAREKGFGILVGHTNRTLERERTLVEQASARRADGVVMVTSVDLAALCGGGGSCPPMVVALDVNIGSALPTVRVDHVGAAETATNYLLHLGHERIAHIMGPKASGMTGHRLEGYQRGLKAAGVPFNRDLCVRGDFTVSSGAAATAELLTRPARPTAIFAANDQMAIGSIRALRDAGVRVPQEISVFGFDDERLAGLYRPAISTVRIPTFDIGYRAMGTLVGILRGEVVESDIVLGTELVIRDSTAPPAVDN